MIRLVFRCFGLIVLAGALAFTVLDAARSIAASTPQLTALATAAAALSPTEFAQSERLVKTTFGPWAWDGIAAPALDLPASMALAIGGLLLLLAAAPGRRRAPA